MGERNPPVLCLSPKTSGNSRAEEGEKGTALHWHFTGPELGVSQRQGPAAQGLLLLT